MSTPPLTPIAEFILQSERNLRVAESVNTEFVVARELLVAQFFDRLTATLQKTLAGWVFEYWSQTLFVKSWGGYSGWKPTWEGQYHLLLQGQDYGAKMIYGIFRDKAIHSRPLSPEVLETVKTAIPSAKSSKWCEAEMILRTPATDWRPAETLWRIHTDAEFLKSVADQLLELAKLTEEPIDLLVAKYRAQN